MIEQILNLPEPVLTGLLLGLFVASLVVAFKVMEMIFDTVTIVALSATFYIGLTYLTAVSFSLNDLLLFSFLGASLYMLYSFLATVISTTESIVKIPVKIILGIYRPTKRITTRVYRYVKIKIRSMREERIEESDDSDKPTREVVLNSD
jgi:hypothetical protein